MTNQEIYNEDHSITIDLYGDMHILSMYASDYSYDDYHDDLMHIVREMTNASVTANTLRHVNIRLIFATELAFDSLHQLGKIFELPYHRLVAQNKIILEPLQSLTAFSKQLDRKLSSRARREVKALPESLIHTLTPAAEFWLKGDPVAQWRTMRVEAGAREYLLLKRSLVMSGWWPFQLRYDWHRAGVNVAYYLRVPLYLARLYFALVQEGLLPKNTWPNMEAFMILQRDALWAGTPKTGEYHNNQALCCGASLTQLAQENRKGNSRSRHMKQNKKAAKMLSHGGVVSRMVLDWVAEHRSSGLEEESLKEILDKSQLRWYNDEAVLPCRVHGWKEAPDENQRKKHIPDLLMALSEAVDFEELELSYDYMTLFRVCWRLAEDLVQEGVPIINRVVASTAESNLSYTIYEEEHYEGVRMASVVTVILRHLFPPDGPARPEAAQIGSIISRFASDQGRAVHQSTRVN